jgi:folate-binding protein YgfZ
MERISDWHHTLAAAGARIDDAGVVSDFGDPAAEAQASATSAVVVPLTGMGLISVCGADAGAFLDSQLTSKVSAVSPTQAQYSGYCTPKGRLLATMLIFMQGDCYWLTLPAELSSDVAQRLQKFILRAKVKVEVASSGLVMFGVTGSRSNATLTEVLGLPSERNFGVRQVTGLTLITLPGKRYLIACPAAQADSTWQHLSAHLRPAGWNAWQLQSIRSGIATVTSATQEAFIPQMLALDTYDAVSFTKGCYPGQEIVARTRYLGNLKRHLYHGHCEQPLAAGDALFEEAAGSAAGTVTNAAENSEHGWELLAVLQREAVSNGVPLRTAGGAAVTALMPAVVAGRDQQ